MQVRKMTGFDDAENCGKTILLYVREKNWQIWMIWKIAVRNSTLCKWEKLTDLDDLDDCGKKNLLYVSEKIDRFGWSWKLTDFDDLENWVNNILLYLREKNCQIWTILKIELKIFYSM